MAPTDCPPTALGFPSLSTRMMASITDDQSNGPDFTALFFAPAPRGNKVRIDKLRHSCFAILIMVSMCLEGFAKALDETFVLVSSRDVDGDVYHFLCLQMYEIIRNIPNSET